VRKSAVSERFVVGTARKPAEPMERKLGLKLTAVMIDGVCVAAVWCWPNTSPRHLQRARVTPISTSRKNRKLP
jgi:hypothetical protein